MAWPRKWIQFSTTRIDRHVLHCCIMRMVKRLYIMAPDGLKAGVTLLNGPDASAYARQLFADAKHSARNGSLLCGNDARSWCGFMPIGWFNVGCVNGSRRWLGTVAIAERRSPPGAYSVPSDDRQDEQSGSRRVFELVKQVETAGKAGGHTSAVQR